MKKRLWEKVGVRNIPWKIVGVKRKLTPGLDCVLNNLFDKIYLSKTEEEEYKNIDNVKEALNLYESRYWNVEKYRTRLKDDFGDK